MKIKIKKITDTAKLPTKNKNTDTGYDLYVDRFEEDESTIKIYTGISIEPEDGWWVEIAPRSSIFKYGLVLSNSIGIIDNGYRGEIMGIFWKIGTILTSSNKNFEKVKIGDRLLQLYPKRLETIEFQETFNLTETDRNFGGFGSSGKN
jgi:dUTP pyrophosphatase